MTMAVGIIIGGAFTSIVNSLVNDVITPVIGIIIGGIDFSAVIIGFGSAQIMVGNFIQSVITFLLTALVIFVMMKLFNRFTRKKQKPPISRLQNLRLQRKSCSLLRSEIC